MFHTDRFSKRVMTNVEMDSDGSDDNDMFKLNDIFETKTKHFLFNFCFQYLFVLVPFCKLFLLKG